MAIDGRISGYWTLRCNALTQSGEPCTARPLKNEKHCRYHLKRARPRPVLTCPRCLKESKGGEECHFCGKRLAAHEERDHG